MVSPSVSKFWSAEGLTFGKDAEGFDGVDEVLHGSIYACASNSAIQYI